MSALRVWTAKFRPVGVHPAKLHPSVKTDVLVAAPDREKAMAEARASARRHGFGSYAIVELREGGL